jgi:hypothetical protein
VKRTAPVVLLIVAALAVAMFWFTVATQPFNVDLERERPPRVYDFFSYYRPNAEYAFTRLRNGDLPLWNPNQGLGGPFLATLQTGVLYPPNWLHLSLPSQPTFVWLAFAHLALAATLAGALARNLGAGTIGSVTAGLLYATSLQLWSSVWTPPTLYTAAWAPGVLLAVERAVARPGAGRAAALAAALGLQILVGWPYAVVMTALAATITGSASLLRALLRTRRVPFAALATIVIGASAGGLLAAPQLLPSIELMRQSARAPGTLEDQTPHIKSEMYDVEILVRGLMRQGVSGGVPGVASPVLAVLAVLLAGCGRARAAVLLAVAALALAISLPNHTPLYQWARQLPLLGDFRFPFRYRLISTLAIAVCAGIGISRIEQRGGQRGVIAATLIASIAVALQAWPIALSFHQMANVFPIEQPRGSGGLFAALTTKADLPKQLAIVRRIEDMRSRSLWRSFATDKMGQSKGILALQDLEPLSLSTTSRIMRFLERGDAGVDPQLETGVRPTRGTPYSGSASIPDEPSRAALFDVMSVRFFIVNSPPPWFDGRYRRDFEVRDAPFLFENPYALPRAWRAVRAEAQPADPQAALARLIDPVFDVHTTVLLDPLPPAIANGIITKDADAMTQIERDEPEHITIRTRGASPAVLVLNDSLYPGWEATLDGVETPLLLANTAFRAVPVPAGEHVVEMRYRPRTFELGLALSGITIALLGAATIDERVRTSRGARS